MLKQLQLVVQVVTVLSAENVKIIIENNIHATLFGNLGQQIFGLTDLNQTWYICGNKDLYYFQRVGFPHGDLPLCYRKIFCTKENQICDWEYI